jgi:hypothetical protein
MLDDKTIVLPVNASVDLNKISFRNAHEIIKVAEIY